MATGPAAGARAPGLRSRALALLALAAWTALIWWLLTGDRIRVGGARPLAIWAFNLGHAPLFGGWAVLVGRAQRPGVVALREPDERRHWLRVALLAVAFGACMEWVQAHTPGRQASAIDVLTDAVGALGVPWGLASGRWFSARALLVFVAAGLVAGWAAFAN